MVTILVLPTGTFQHVTAGPERRWSGARSSCSRIKPTITMKHALPCLVLAIVFTGPSGHAQWCVPTTAVPYAASMPGIVTFTCNTIVRTSQDIENYPYNSYVNTGLSTTLSKGESYNVTIAFTIDDLISPHMNLRIWIDLNQDGQLDDPGETLLSVDHLPGPTHTGTITIPATATNGPTRMRVTAKMCSHGGHSLPTPCDMPPDPLGYHGEIEDYTVEIVDANGVLEHAGSIISAAIVPMPATDASELVITSTSAGALQADVLDMSGRLQRSRFVSVVPGSQRIALHDLEGLVNGNYVLRLVGGDAVRTIPFVVVDR